MGNTTNTVVAKDAALPTGEQVRSIIPRVASNVREDQRAMLTGVLDNAARVIDSSVQALDRKLKGFAFTESGRELVASEAVAEATAMLRVITDSATKDHRAHMAALDAELAQVPEINEFRATEIRTLLREMKPSERELFIARNDDPEVLAAVAHGPKAFPLASDDATNRARLNFNKAFRPEKVALRDDAESYVTAIDNFADMVARELRRVLR